MSLWQEVAGLAAKVPPKKKKCQDEASKRSKGKEMSRGRSPWLGKDNSPGPSRPSPALIWLKSWLCVDEHFK